MGYVTATHLEAQELLQLLVVERPVTDLALVLLHSNLLEMVNVDTKGSDSGVFGASLLVLTFFLLHSLWECTVFQIL